MRPAWGAGQIDPRTEGPSKGTGRGLLRAGEEKGNCLRGGSRRNQRVKAGSVRHAPPLEGGPLFGHSRVTPLGLRRASVVRVGRAMVRGFPRACATVGPRLGSRPGSAGAPPRCPAIQRVAGRRRRRCGKPSALVDHGPARGQRIPRGRSAGGRELWWPCRRGVAADHGPKGPPFALNRHRPVQGPPDRAPSRPGWSDNNAGGCRDRGGTPARLSVRNERRGFKTVGRGV